MVGLFCPAALPGDGPRPIYFHPIGSDIEASITHRNGSIPHWVFKPDDTPATILFGRSNVLVAVAIQVNQEGVVHLLA